MDLSLSQATCLVTPLSPPTATSRLPYWCAIAPLEQSGSLSQTTDTKSTLAKRAQKQTAERMGPYMPTLQHGVLEMGESWETYSLGEMPAMFRLTKFLLGQEEIGGQGALLRL